MVRQRTAALRWLGALWLMSESNLPPNLAHATSRVDPPAHLQLDAIMRRQFSASTAHGLGTLGFSGAVVFGETTALALSACTSEAETYDQAVALTWRSDALLRSDRATPLQEIGCELVRCATLASSSHNTQCWKFALPGFSVRNMAISI